MNKAVILQLLRQNVPELFTSTGQLLYIGACVRHFTAARELHQAGHHITILEVWRPWLDKLMESDQAKYVDKAICGDIQNFSANGYDYVLWLHGPEHVEKEVARQVLERLSTMAETIVIGCPDGWMANPARDGNPHAEHKSAWQVADFKRLGWQVARAGDELLAWKQKQAAKGL